MMSNPHLSSSMMLVFLPFLATLVFLHQKIHQDNKINGDCMQHNTTHLLALRKEHDEDSDVQCDVLAQCCSYLISSSYVLFSFLSETLLIFPALPKQNSFS